MATHEHRPTVSGQELRDEITRVLMSAGPLTEEEIIRRSWSGTVSVILHGIVAEDLIVTNTGPRENFDPGPTFMKVPFTYRIRPADDRARGRPA